MGYLVETFVQRLSFPSSETRRRAKFPHDIFLCVYRLCYIRIWSVSSYFLSQYCVRYYYLWCAKLQSICLDTYKRFPASCTQILLVRQTESFSGRGSPRKREPHCVEDAHSHVPAYNLLLTPSLEWQRQCFGAIFINNFSRQSSSLLFTRTSRVCDLSFLSLFFSISKMCGHDSLATPNRYIVYVDAREQEESAKRIQKNQSSF